MNKQYKSVLEMVWKLDGKLQFKIWFTWIVIKKRFKSLFKKGQIQWTKVKEEKN